MAQGRTSRRARSRISRAAYLVILAFGALVMFIPFAWSLSTSLKPLSEALAYPPQWIPRVFDWGNYVKIWKLVPLARWFGNSAIAAFGVTVANLVLDSMAGYALARLDFRGKRLLFLGVLAMLMVPFQSVMLPVYIILKDLGLLDNYYGLILPLAVQAVGVFLMRQAFLNLPEELEDAAAMDGAGRFRMFWQLSLPLVIPSLLTLGLISFMLSWNNFLLPLLVANQPNLWTVPLGVVMFQQEYFVNWPYLMAAAVMTTIPVAVVFLAFQKWFVKGIATTGIR